MQFRQRGKSVRVIRTGYNAETKKPTTEVVGKLTEPNFEVPAELREKLTSEELAEVTAYTTNAARNANIEHEHAAQNLLRNVELTSKWLAAADPERAKAYAADLQKPLKKLRRTLDTALGGGKSAKPASKSE